MKNEPSILEAFREREDEIRKEADALDKELNKKRIEREKDQRNALAKLETARAALAKMKADYGALAVELEAKAAADLRARAVTAEKVERGEASLSEFMASGLSVDEIKTRAAAEVKTKLAEAAKIIRAKAAEIFQLELDEAQARVELVYLSTYPGQNLIARLKTEIGNLDRGLMAILGGYCDAHADRDRSKINLELCADRSLGGLTFDSMTFEELKDLRFDPRFTDAYSANLESCISQMSAGQRCSLILCPGGFGRDKGLRFRILDDERPRRAVTT